RVRGRVRHGQPREDGRLQTGLVHRKTGRADGVVQMNTKLKSPLAATLRVFFGFMLLVCLTVGLADAASLEDRVIEHHLQNGLTLLVMERHHVPIVAVNLTYKVGGANEHSGITGVAHLY